jgi:flavin reductase (DIM6/NTAB) family NADH-FMN oxidoreductase RutF
MCDPQSEVSVWLDGAGASLDVTQNNIIVAAHPLIIGIGLEKEIGPADIVRRHTVLRFNERCGEQRLLGEIRLRMIGTIPLGNEQLCLFETRGSRNHCVPRCRLWLRYLDQEYRKWRSARHSETPTPQMPAAELRSVFAFYICPRPVVLVTVVHGRGGNIFPMDLIGPVGTRHFALALHNTSAPLPLIEQSRHIALSCVPLECSSLASDLGRNHKTPVIDFCSLPFATTASASFGLPVPRFALRVREMQIETMRQFESHTLLVGKTISNEFRADGLQMFHVHGSYQMWRQRKGRLNSKFG